MEPTRVLIADDHPLFRDGVRALLSSVDDLELVAEAATGEEAVELATREQPDVVLMDINMPGLSGIEATRHILSTSPHVAVLVLTMFEDDDLVFSAMRSGARGYLLKAADQDELLRAIRAVASGEAIFGPAIAERLMDYFNPRRSAGAPDVFPELTAREREILGLIAAGMTNAQISQHLVISAKTTRNHVSNIFNKLQVTDRVQAALRARDAGLGPTTE